MFSDHDETSPSIAAVSASEHNSYTSKTVKIHHLVRFEMHYFITAVPVAKQYITNLTKRSFINFVL